MKALSNTGRFDATVLQVEPNPMAHRIVGMESIKKSRKSRKIDSAFAVVLIVAASVFAVALAVYVLSPAISTLVSSGPGWTPEGP